MGTNILLILVDESLSMRSRRSEIVKGINRFIDVQRSINSDGCRLILIKFNNNVTVLHRGTDINVVEPLRITDYNPGGKTALFDAVQLGIDITNEIKEKDDRVTCIAITDGEDNASTQNVSAKPIKKLVYKYDVKPDWSFTYIGKSPDYWTRTKPVSKVSYESNRQHVWRQSPSTAATRRLREYVNRRNSLLADSPQPKGSSLLCH